MSMSTGDVRRPNTKLSAKAAATDKPESEVVDDAPAGGVLPVKKSARSGSSTGTSSTGTSSTGTSSTGTRTAKAAPAKTTPTKTTPSKVSPAKKAAGAK